MSRYVWIYVRFFLILVFLSAGVILGVFYHYSKELPPLGELQRFELKIGSEVYDKYDKLIHVFSIEQRKLTNINELPDYLVNGLIAVEDKNFNQHWGIDITGIIRAIIVDLKHMDFSQGASTITQQLARNMFLSLDKQIPRKIKEFLLAVQIERHYSKSEILEYYFNKAPFGPGLYGVEVASQKYFNKEAKDVTIPEAALLIGMPQLPGAYYPYRYPEKALRRRNFVLSRMRAENVITEEEFRTSRAKEIELVDVKQNFRSADYFIEHIRQILENKYGTTRLFTSGMKIYTSIDMDLQAYADSILNMNLTKFEKKNKYSFQYSDFPPDTTDIVTPYVQGGVLLMDNETGFVTVMIGGRNFNHSKFNRITQARRQPGSSFKPILYTAAIEKGYTPATIIKDEPICFIEQDTLFWKVHNYSRTNYGYTRMREGISHSRNIYAVKTIYDIEPRWVRTYAQRFGLTTPVSPFYSLAVGTSVLYPIELITAYTTFPNNGKLVKPLFIRKVEDMRGNVLETAKTEHIEVVDEKTAFLMRSMLQSVVDEGTGVGVRWQPNCNYRWTAAGKTGTTDEYKDAWFIGFNKKHTLGIWVGFDDNTTLGRGQSGATAALPSWPYIMKKAIEMVSPKDKNGNPIVDGANYRFDEPEGIVKVRISKRTGLLPKSSLEETIEEYFIEGTQPNPLSDSLTYNFYPTFYRENLKDSLVFDLGGRRYIYPDTTRWVRKVLNTNKPNEAIMVPKRLPPPIDLRGALIIKDKKVVTRPDSLLFNAPKNLRHLYIGSINSNIPRSHLKPTSKLFSEE
jgi:penicillin-binding protein 1A